MMIRKIIFLFVIQLFILISCNNKTENTKTNIYNLEISTFYDDLMSIYCYNYSNDKLNSIFFYMLIRKYPLINIIFEEK